MFDILPWLFQVLVCVYDQRFVTKEVCQPLHVYVRRNIFSPQVISKTVTIYDYHPGEDIVTNVTATDGDGVSFSSLHLRDILLYPATC